MNRLTNILAVGWLALAACCTAADWEEILGAAQGKVPAATGFGVTWRTNLTGALGEARNGNRPLFVTFRCLPCKQCSAFDKEVFEGGPDLDPLLNQFITVRLTNAADIELRIFPVEGFADLDMSWWGWFLSPEGKVYGVFGGRDEVSDATRISKTALIASLWRVLKHHYDPRRESWNIDGPAPNLSGPARSPRQLPGYDGWLQRAHESVRRQTCLHCHQVNDILREPAVAAGTFNKKRDFDVWPLPENVGLSLDRDDGLLVTNVVPSSPAARAGIKSGDTLGVADGRRCFSQTDFRGALHRGPKGSGEMKVWWTRSGKVMSGVLTVEEGWRKTVLDWRMSVSQGIVGAYPGFFPIALNPQRREKLLISNDKMAVEPFLGQVTNSAAYLAGLRGNQVVTAVNGESPNLGGRAFLVWFVQKYDPGDRVTLTVTDPVGQKRDISYDLPRRGQ